jgi:sec-independent protein translocase protein TatB
MLDVAPQELLMVALVALVVIGPKDLPKTLRVIGQWVGRARGVARQFRSGFDTMVREAELEEMEKRWAEENARIMKEHSAGTQAGSATTDPAAGEAAPVGSFDGTGSHDPFNVEPDPVFVEKPEVAAAPHKPEGAAS